MPKWTVIGEWGEHKPPDPVRIAGVFVRVEKRKPQTALLAVERMVREKDYPAIAQFHRYVIVGPDGRRFSPQALRNMIGGKNRWPYAHTEYNTARTPVLAPARTGAR